MDSNSKLTPGQKLELKGMLIEAKSENIEVVFLNNETTMAFQDCGSTVKFSLAVKSSHEKKFRFNVGEYHVLDRFRWGHYAIMAREDFIEMCESVWGVLAFD